MRRVLLMMAILVVGGVAMVRVARAADARPELRVGVPLGLSDAVGAAVGEFRKSHPGAEVKLVPDTPEGMVRKLVKGELALDVFISPGGHEAVVLREKGLLEAKTMAAFGDYRLAILVPAANPGRVKGPGDLMRSAVKTVTMSDRELSSVSHAAEQALGRMKLWRQVAAKATFLPDCAASFKTAVEGKTEANLQFLGCPVDPSKSPEAGKKIAFAYTFSRDACDTPRNVAGVLVKSGQPRLAREFVAFLAAAKMQGLMVKKGMRHDAGVPLRPGAWEKGR
jgi:ABC-type molybdate transport system substrate-binding protein